MKFLSLSLTVLALGAASALATPFGVSARKKTTLKAAAKPLYFGAALGQGHLQNTSDTMFKKLAKQQFSGATPENEMKWEIIEPEQDQFDFGPGDFIANFAKQNNMVLRGHTLVWHNQLAPFVSNLTGNALLKAMKNHITTVMSHYKGQVYGWDVVNEAFNDDGTLGASPFLSQIGPDYIKIAFQTARKADPGAKLYINDFNTEGINNKSDALLSLVQSLKAENLIDGVGFQSHFIIGELPPDLQANLQRFVDSGVEVAITELDIRTELPLTAALETQQSKDYTTVVNACQAVEKCVGVTTWGITDLYSWIPGTFPGQGGALLWDDSYNEKPSFQATLAALQ